MKRIILLIIVAAVVVGGIIGYRMYSKETSDIVNIKPDAVVTAADLLAAFERDTASASRQYVGKTIEVTGQVKKIDTSGAVELGIPDSESSVVCGLDRRHHNDHQKLKVGSPATLQGQVSGYTKGEEMLGVSMGTNIQLSFAGVKDKQ